MTIQLNSEHLDADHVAYTLTIDGEVAEMGVAPKADAEDPPYCDGCGRGIKSGEPMTGRQRRLYGLCCDYDER